MKIADRIYSKCPTNAHIVKLVLLAAKLKTKEVALFSLARILHHLSKFFWSNWVLIQLDQMTSQVANLFVRNVVQIKAHFMELGYNRNIQ